MGDSQGNTYRSERVGYSSTSTYTSISKKNGSIIDDLKFKKESDERKKAAAIIKSNEKGYTAQLTELGKLCSYIETFDNILISEQNIPQVGPFENPIECQSFKNGYEHGKMLIGQGFSEENYKDFAAYYETKYMINDKNNHK